MISGLDGQPFQLKGSLTQFDPNNQDHTLFDKYDAEIIMIGGSPLYYYEVFIQDQTIDPILLEDRGKLFSNFPVMIYGYYEPPAQMNASGIFGIDTPDEEVVFECNNSAVLAAIGHAPKRGSRIFTPHRRENWEIIDIKLDQFKLWSTLHMTIHCRKYQENTTDGSDNPSQPQTPAINVFPAPVFPTFP